MIEECQFKGWKRNLRLKNEHVELIVTLDVGPRVIHCGRPGGPNLFMEMESQIGRAGEESWQLRGGHRFWTAPEHEHSYALDNSPVDYQKTGPDAVEIVSPPEKKYGWQKIMRVELDPEGEVTVIHRLRNGGAAPLRVTPWGITVMPPGCVAVIPQPRFREHPSLTGEVIDYDNFLPNRNIVVWPYTSLDDERYRFGRDYWVVRHRHGKPPIKIGLRHENGWVAGQIGDTVFCKHVPHIAGCSYPDHGVNFELFTNDEVLELESLAPAEQIPPGSEREHVEKWRVLPCADDLSDPKHAAAFFARLP